MIEFRHVSKRYVRSGTEGPWVLQDVSLSIPGPEAIAVIGAKGSGKTTLLRMVSGAERPTVGDVLVNGRVSYPTKFVPNLQPLLSGRQNARFICRINGHESDLDERLQRMEDILQLGAKFDEPLKTYGAKLKARFGFALSWIIDFDVYLLDGFNPAGELGFGGAAAARDALERLRGRAGLLWVAKGAKEIEMMRQLCTRAIMISEGTARLLDELPKPGTKGAATQNKGKALAAGRPPPPNQATPLSPEVRTALANVKRAYAALDALSAGLRGQAPVVGPRLIEKVERMATEIGLELVDEDRMQARGLALRPGAEPLIVQSDGQGAARNYFDARTQCVAGEAGTGSTIEARR